MPTWLASRSTEETAPPLPVITATLGSCRAPLVSCRARPCSGAWADAGAGNASGTARPETASPVTAVLRRM